MNNTRHTLIAGILLAFSVFFCTYLVSVRPTNAEIGTLCGAAPNPICHPSDCGQQICELGQTGVQSCPSGGGDLSGDLCYTVCYPIVKCKTCLACGSATPTPSSGGSGSSSTPTPTVSFGSGTPTPTATAEPSTLSVDLTAASEGGSYEQSLSGSSPLDSVSLQAAVSGTQTGPITYIFDCGDGSDPIIVADTDTNPRSVNDVCNYDSPGTYTATVTVTR